ncbi:MAG: DMT family transporter [Alphaproteobacteria bacterium]|nr:DMT family transporter [Alphaproteobacteria bacterium]
MPLVSAHQQEINSPSGETQHDNILKGALFAAAAFFLLAVMGACAKLLTADHNVMEVAFYRNAVPLVLMMAYVALRRKKGAYAIGNKRLLIMRVGIGIIGLVCTFGALQQLPISDATVIFMGSNLIIPVLAFFLLKEHVGPYRWMAILIGFCGVFLVAAPTGHINPLGVALAMAAACVHATIQVILRRLKNENPFAVTFYFTLGGAVFSALFLPWVAEFPTGNDMILYLILGCSGGLAQYCLTNAFKYAPATIAAPFNYTGLLWATGLDIMIWHYVPGWNVFVGGAIIIAAKIFILHRERKNRQKISHISESYGEK